MTDSRIVSLLAALGVACLILAPGMASASPEAPAVLFLEEDDAGRPGYVSMMNGFRESLERSQRNMVAIYQENLDFARFSHEDYREEYGRWLRQKYRSKEIDVVVASGPVSVKLAGEFRKELWPGAKVIALGGAPPADGPSENPVSWLVVRLDVRGTVRAARELMPEATRLVVVMGAKSAYQGMNEFILGEVEAAAGGLGLSVERLVGLSLEETRRRVSALPANVIVFYGSISLDGNGVACVPRDVLANLAKVSGAPVFGMSESFLGYGLTGGVLLRMEKLGRELAAMTAEAIEAPAGAPPSARSSTALDIVFDWRELQRYGLGRRQLPAGAELRFAPRSIWEEHRNAVLGGATLLAGQSGLIVAFMVQFRRRKSAELKVLRQRDQLAHAGRVSSLGQLAAAIAHELNQPLGAILMNAGAAERLLQKAEPDLPELRAIIADIRSDDTRASSVIERMRALLTGHPMRFEPVDLKELLRQAAELLECGTRRSGIVLKTVTAPGLPLVHGDRVHLQQLVINLALNAMDALGEKPGGAVVLLAERPSPDGMVVLKVRDTGPGIPDSIRATLFEPFQTTKPAGMGMGLAISQTIAQAHGGTLGVESSGPEGTCFYCTLHPAPHPSLT